MGNFRVMGATGDGSAPIDSGNFHEVLEIDAELVTPGFYVKFVSTVAPRRTYQIGWVGLTVAAAFPGTSSPVNQYTTAQMFIESERMIFTEPASNSVNFPWGADTMVWSLGDSTVNLNVWWP